MTLWFGLRGSNTKHRLTATAVVLILTVALFVEASGVFAATCTGADPCNACKNCKYCRHCAKEGGKCGVCKR